MPLWLKGVLPHLAIAAAVVGAIWYIHDRGYSTAMADRDARDAKLLAQVRSDLRQSEQRLAGSIAEAAGTYEAQRAALGRAGATLQPIILQEAARDSRLSDPAAGLTPVLLDAVNRARASGGCAATAAGRIECALPTASAAARQRDR